MHVLLIAMHVFVRWMLGLVTSSILVLGNGYGLNLMVFQSEQSFTHVLENPVSDPLYPFVLLFLGRLL